MNTANTQSSVEQHSLKLDHLEAYVQSIMDKWDIPGLSLAIVKDGKPVVVKGYGTKEAGKDLPVDQNTLFPISAGTSMFTASALALLVAEGQLSWDDRLTDLLPGFRTGSALINEQATVIDALAQRIGLPAEYRVCFPSPNLSRADLLNKLRVITDPTGFRTGQGSSFLLTMAAGEIIPALTDHSWDDYVQQRLFKPLGMTDSVTGPHLLHNLSGNNVATPHDQIGDQRVTVPHTQSHNVGPALSAYSSAADMAKWLQFQLDNGKVGEQELIPQQQMDDMRKIHLAQTIGLKGFVPELSGYGLGALALTSHTGYRVYCTGGDMEGTESFFGFVPELKLGIAVMINAHEPIPHGLLPWIIDRYTGATDRDWIAEIIDRSYTRQSTRKRTLDQQRAQLTRPEQVPSLPLEDYVGVYHHPYLGDLSIRQEKEMLIYTLSDIWEGELPHCNHNTFFREPIKPHFHRVQFRGPLRFNLSIEGDVESLTIDKEDFVNSGF